MKRAKLILNVIALLLIVLQVLGYWGTMDNAPTQAEGIDLAAFYVGFNLPAILALVLLIIAQYLKRKLKRKEVTDMLNTIGDN
jgi:TRAP-type C4-dicarboxylate transport system permease small subunit